MAARPVRQAAERARQFFQNGFVFNDEPDVDDEMRLSSDEEDALDLELGGDGPEDDNIGVEVGAHPGNNRRRAPEPAEVYLILIYHVYQG